jgi:hypothetical protein
MPPDTRSPNRCRLGPWSALLAAALLLGAALLPQAAGAQAQPDELGWLDALYRQGDGFRAESEALRFLRGNPRHPRRDAVELLRVKLYYREGRYGEAELMLHSLLDRYPSGRAAPSARFLLLRAQARLGRIPAPGAGPRPPVSGAAPEEERAVTWSTWLPGAGFFVLDEPAKAGAALGLNAAFTAGTVLAYQQANVPAALLFGLVEVALYRGGREAVRTEAQALDRRRRQTAAQGAPSAEEAAVLAVGIEEASGGRPE